MSNGYSRIVVLGAGGQVGRALTEQLGKRAIPLTRKEADLSQPKTLLKALADAKPDAVINAAAYTQVDKAESEEEAAYQINAKAVSEIAKFCAAEKIPFVHYSTDYVFDGTGERPWRENDAKAPLGVYGASKRAGEEAVEMAGGAFLIFRTSWVYDADGSNFLNTMLLLGAEREELKVVADQFGAPSYAPHLAEATIACLDKAATMEAFPTGIYHMVNAGETTWHGFAAEIFSAARAKQLPIVVKTVEPIPSSAYPTPAKRPHNSRLNCAKLHTVFGVHMPKWEAGLAEAMEKKHASHRVSA